MQLIFWLIETLFFPIFSESSKLPQEEAVYSLTGTYFSVNSSFWLVETSFFLQTVLFYSVVFPAIGDYY